MTKPRLPRTVFATSYAPAAPACRVCATVIVYDPDPTRVGIAKLFDSTEAAGTTDYAVGVDQKSAPGQALASETTPPYARGLLLRLPR